ncbi:hypothetical protein GCM10017691_63680 [Pseudonocardia petroleophila]|uniref:Uncharacterized protein n=1 Tax=Pseudonocardia petroleophila TaxID=37331 RepID=A0A7G7MLM7_9PSEU|nr:hypothetical protein [Pseudonocardia petroleophila]QNG53688.1 hypothetical protein H6H00_07020 [Pseudonocardia petroleophila]
MPTARNAEREYAWNWFALHSGQRMQLVNFWLVAISFLGAAYVQARIGNLRGIAAGIAMAGMIASVSFSLLDERTRRLIDVAEDALRGLEVTQGEQADAGDICVGARLVVDAGQARRSRLYSYRVIIQGLQYAVAALFAAATVLAFV